jgi:PAS domain S-box-containing protein
MQSSRIDLPVAGSGAVELDRPARPLAARPAEPDRPAPEPEPGPPRRRGAWNSVRGRLTLLIVAITVPAVLLVGLLTVQAYRNERESVAGHLVATARALATLVDQQLMEYETMLKGLATSLPIERDDIMGFDTRARSLLQASGAGENECWISLYDARGQMLVHTLRPLGSSLPQSDLEPALLAAARAGHTYTSNVSPGVVAHGLRIAIAVPVLRRGELRYIITLGVRPSAFGAALDVSRIAPKNLVAVMDREGAIATRTRAPEDFVGKRMSHEFAQLVAGRTEAVFQNATLDGEPVLTAFSRSPRSDWSVGVSAPRTELYASARRLLWLGFGVCGLILGTALVMANGIGRALVRGVDRLVSDTEALGRGVVPPARPTDLAETDFVADAMRRTAERLVEKERDNASLTAALQTELEKQTRAEETSRRLAAIVSSSADAIIGKGLDGIITSWNKGAEQIYGYSAQEIIGHSVTELCPPERQEEERAILASIRRNHAVTALETVRRRKGGEPVEIALTVSPIIDGDGRVLGASSIARDITEKKRAELQQQALYELVASVNRSAGLDEIYAAALDAICRCQNAPRASILLFDADGVMRFKAARGLSRAYQRAVEGHSPWAPDATNPEPIGIEDVTTATLEPGLRQVVLEEGIRALAFIPLTYEQKLLGKFMIYYDTPHRFERLELRPVEAMASQVAFAITRQQTAAALEKLVDERTASLKQAVAQMQEFSYSVSHDLRAPVRAMYGFAEAVLENNGHRLDDEGREMLTRILRNGARMDRLIQDLLTYSRVSRREINLEPVSLEKLVGEVVQQYPAMQPPNADIIIASPLPEVIAHEPSLTQVMSNLLSNAVKFVPPGQRPKVHVGFERKSGRVRVWIEDNGIGIKPEYQGRLFGMFERVHPDKQYEGTGIGLAIVRKAVERMNGAVGVESDGINGSRFWVDLPAARKG